MWHHLVRLVGARLNKTWPYREIWHSFESGHSPSWQHGISFYPQLLSYWHSLLRPQVQLKRTPQKSNSSTRNPSTSSWVILPPSCARTPVPPWSPGNPPFQSKTHGVLVYGGTPVGDLGMPRPDPPRVTARNHPLMWVVTHSSTEHEHRCDWPFMVLTLYYGIIIACLALTILVNMPH